MLQPPIEPMLARPLGHEVPEGLAGMAAEPKWDGFRCLVFRDDHGVVLQGRGRSRPGGEDCIDLAYAFPEVVSACAGLLPPGTVVDAELVIPHDGRLDFGALTSRLRPRSEAGGTNIARLADETPATLLAFDLLWSSGDLMAAPLSSRREALTALSTSWQAPLLVTPQTLDPSIARDWFDRFESAGVDGLILKPLDDPYAPGQRAQFKIKHRRTADVVVAGWRPHARPGADGRDVVGSLLLGLHDDGGRLQYVGVASAFPAAKRAELVDLLAPYEVGADAPHPWRGAGPGRVPGEVNRWNAARRAGEPAWHALRPELVAEVTYDQLEGDRLRHVAGFARWRPDRDASTCGYDQLEVPPASTISGLLPLGR